VPSDRRLSSSPTGTERIASVLARRLSPGACVALYGELGAGKTRFVRGLVRGLGGDASQVASPTFVLLNVYDAPRMKVYHLDAYRVSGAEDFAGIGFAELLEQEGVVVIEWAERVSQLLPVDRIDVRIAALDENRRAITIERRAAQ
jgi:tRNA threonylcarbamoyladenosine biosynthesis protein TsaE